MVKVPLYPLRFAPFLRPMPWGGQRLKKWLTVDWPSDAKVGEAWLLSDHALHQSVVTNGPLAGRTLSQLLAERGTELLGFAANRFPLLIKLLDAEENLSIQVHPDDELARRWAPTEGGKSESWLVLESTPNAAIYLGLQPDLNRAKLQQALEAGTLPQCVKRYDPKPGECYNVPAGSIHALGGGTVVLEVQQTSDATFRLYDWGRVDATGKPRSLHWEAGIACLKEFPPELGPQQIQRGEDSKEILVDTTFFRIQKRKRPAAVTGPSMLISFDGMATLESKSESFLLHKGELWLVPAVTGVCQITQIESEVIEIIPKNQ
jgi:mannose-6-phosphate isomerase